MRNMNKISALIVACVFIGNTANAWYDWSKKGSTGNTGTGNSIQAKAANCSPASTFSYLELNNVSALIETGGSMWQDRSRGNAAYEVPAGSNETVIYSGALWLGGVDVNNQLKIAALTFRQGNDFWTGPLTSTPGTGNIAIGIKDYGPAEIDPETCLEYDNFYVTERKEIAEFNAWWECQLDPDCDLNEKFPSYSIPASITNWPAHGDVGKFQDFYLAPFYDRDGDGVYNPAGAGDYPWYDLDNSVDCRTSRQVTLFGDYNMWWVFNDKGNIHTETSGDPIGMEIRAQAFAFATNDEINNMTFYNYELINRSTQTLTETYFGVWVDSDIGCSEDDYVGCDVQRGLGYAFNADAIDNDGCNGVQPIGANPPAIGVDFFEGPYQDNDGLDNPLTTDISQANADKGIPYEGLGIGYGDGIIDNERFGMRRFVYFDRTLPANIFGDPSFGIQYYNYLRGIWIDGTKFSYGGNGHVSDPASTGIEAAYCFPGDTDPYGWGVGGTTVTDWSEIGESNAKGDRRFCQSAGPFTLEPGALNNITIGVVYAKATSGDPFESVELVRKADDKAQALFDNCFRILNGPDAPDVTIQELDKELILYISNPSTSNNYLEQYVEVDPIIAALSDTLDNQYRFQGYQVYQLAEETVGPSELNDPDRARLIRQCDIKDGVGQLINFVFNEDLGASEPIEMVNGADEGITHSFQVMEDDFAQGDRRLINHKKYYFMVLAYGYNNYKDYNPTDPTALDGQQFPYKAGRKSASGSIQSFVGIPHIVSPELGGTIQNSVYGDGPAITRVEGRGNGGNILDLDETSEAEIVSQYTPKRVTYVNAKGPVDVKVVDPLNVKGGDYEIRFIKDGANNLDSATWYLVRFDNENGNDTIFSDVTIEVGTEQLIPEWGISVNIQQYQYPQVGDIGGDYSTELLESGMVFEDSSLQWLSGVEDVDGNFAQNWIRSGTSEEECDTDLYPDVCEDGDPCFFNDELGWDDLEYFESVVEGTWAPYRLVADGDCNHTPISGQFGSTKAMNDIAFASSVDIVLTSDRSKWTRAVVVETQDNSDLSWDGQTNKMEVKLMPSIDKYGNPTSSPGTESTNPNDANFMSGTGMGWFPGYAIDVESGERLNIAYGEDSWLGNEGGKDMVFNPSGNMYTNFGDPLFGGKHYVYVFKNSAKDPANLSTYQSGMPAYDRGAFLKEKLIDSQSSGNAIKVWRSCMWVGMPMLSDLSNGLSDANDPYSYIETDVKIRIRVGNNYERHSDAGTWVNDAGTLGQSDNEWYPLYEFNMDDLATTTADAYSADSAMALVNVVPNPYYAYSNYEETRLTNLVKIVNLPDQCEIKIYTVSGTLVRTFNKDTPITSIDWDLKNHAGVPISSGMYLIHVKATLEDGKEVERLLKWFGVVRPPDLDNF